MSAAAARHDSWVWIGNERGDEWERVAGTRIFPVQSFLPTRGTLPGLGDQAIYLLALDVVPSDVKDKIIEHLCRKFGVSGEELRRELASGTIPILAADCVAWSTGMWFL